MCGALREQRFAWGNVQRLQRVSAHSTPHLPHLWILFLGQRAEPPVELFCGVERDLAAVILDSEHRLECIIRMVVTIHDKRVSSACSWPRRMMFHSTSSPEPHESCRSRPRFGFVLL